MGRVRVVLLRILHLSDTSIHRLFHLRPILTKLTKGRQKPDDFHANTERLLRDVQVRFIIDIAALFLLIVFQSAVKEAQDRRMATHGTEGGFFTPNVPRSVASMARSIRSSISSKVCLKFLSLSHLLISEPD